MSNTSKIFLNKITDGVVIQILKAVIHLFEEEEIEYFIVGAIARDIGLLAAGYKGVPARKTKDVDLAVMVGSLNDYNRLIAKILTLSDFHLHQSEPYRLLFKKTYEVDFLPFGEISDKDGIVKIKTFELNMPGFDAVFTSIKTIYVEEGLRLKFSSLSGIILLKLIAFDDRPAARTKDITDIGYILTNFYDLFVEQIIENASDLIDLYQNKNTLFDVFVSAHFIGREIGTTLQNHTVLRKRVISILEKELEKPKMARLLPGKELDEKSKIFKAMLIGLKETLNQ